MSTAKDKAAGAAATEAAKAAVKRPRPAAKITPVVAKAKEAAPVQPVAAVVASATPAAVPSEQAATDSPPSIDQDAARERVVVLTKEHVETAAKASRPASMGYDDMVQFNRDNVDAAVKAGMVIAKGLQDVNRSVMVLAQTQAEEGLAASRRLASAKTLQDVFEIQSALIKGSMDKIVLENGKLIALNKVDLIPDAADRKAAIDELRGKLRLGHADQVLLISGAARQGMRELLENLWGILHPSGTKVEGWKSPEPVP